METQNLIDRKNVIAIDGLAATGKSSLAYGLAQQLKFQYLNTGLLYRAFAWLIIKNNKFSLLHDQSELQRFIQSYKVLVNNDNNNQTLIIANNDIIPQVDLQSEEISNLASTIAVFESLREHLLPVQRSAYSNENIVTEGRDTTTVVFPHALIKIFVKAPLEARLERRFIQLYGRDHDYGVEKVKELKKQIQIDMLARDERDTTRPIAPCIPAKGALIYENNAPTLTQALKELYDRILALEEFCQFSI